METVEAIQRINIVRQLLVDDGQFPNNGLLPLIIYQKVLQVPEETAGETIEELFESNDWRNAWQGGIFDYHHYHSTAHEVLGVIQGSARIEFGGPVGVTMLLEKGDVVIIPAGVAHKAVDVYDEFKVVGAYPHGQNFDMNYGSPAEREKAMENIKSLALPLTDPVYGMEGPLLTNWISVSHT